MYTLEVHFQAKACPAKRIAYLEYFTGENRTDACRNCSVIPDRRSRVWNPANPALTQPKQLSSPSARPTLRHSQTPQRKPRYQGAMRKDSKIKWELSALLGAVIIGGAWFFLAARDPTFYSCS